MLDDYRSDHQAFFFCIDNFVYLTILIVSFWVKCILNKIFYGTSGYKIYYIHLK